MHGIVILALGIFGGRGQLQAAPVPRQTPTAPPNNIDVPTFYMYDDPAITMKDWNRTCDKTSQEDITLIRQLKRHRARTEDPMEAELFVIPIPIYQSFICNPNGHPQRMETAFNALTTSKWFTRYNGADHLLPGFHYKFSKWAPNEKFWSQKWISRLQEVTLTRYEVYGQSQWVDRFHDEPLQPSSLFNAQWEHTKRSMVVPYGADADIPLVEAGDFTKWSARTILIWYHTRTAGSAHGATKLRHRPWDGKAFACPDCDIGRGTIPREEWLSGWGKSKFCLVIRGDTPTSHALYSAIQGGCIPVVISKGFERVGLPFKDTIDLDTFAVRFSETKWVDGGMESLVRHLNTMTAIELRSKKVGLHLVQPLLLWGHPHSVVVDAVLTHFQHPDKSTTVPLPASSTSHRGQVIRTTDTTPPSLKTMVGAFPNDGVDSIVVNIGSSLEPLKPPNHGLALIFEPIAHEGATKVAKANDARIQGGRSIVVPAAVAANALITTMRVYNNNGVSSSLAQPMDPDAHWASNDVRGDGRTVEVPVLSMTEVMEWIPSGVPIGTVKTDMQGFDYEAVSSLPRSELERPALIQSEVYLEGVSSYKGVRNDFCQDWLPFILKNQCTIQRMVEQCGGKTLDGADADDYCRGTAKRLGTCEADLFWACEAKDNPTHSLNSKTPVTAPLLHGQGNYMLDFPNGMHTPLSWSQYGQDRYIDTLFHSKSKRDGFFVEVGGFDGEKFSNTLFLEKERGWDGLLVEANPYTFALLEQRDRKCWFANACLSNTLPEMTFVVSGASTSAKETMTASFQQRIKHDVRTYGKSGDKRWVHAGEEVTTQCRSLESMMDEIGRDHIDYFSLDVEGAEMVILESIPFDRVSIDVFTIEMDQNAAEIEAFMHTKGYEIHHRLRGDAVFRRRGSPPR